MSKRSSFRYFKTSPEIIRLPVMLYVRLPLSLRNVEDLLHESGIEVSHEMIRFWWNRFGSTFRRKRVERMKAYPLWKWHHDEMFMKINGRQHYLWRAVDHEGVVLESFVAKTRNRKAALKVLRESQRRYGSPKTIVTDRYRSYGAALRETRRGRSPGDAPVAQQSGGELAPAVPTTRAGDAAIPADAKSADGSPPFMPPSATAPPRWPSGAASARSECRPTSRPVPRCGYGRAQTVAPATPMPVGRSK